MESSLFSAARKEVSASVSGMYFDKSSSAEPAVRLVRSTYAPSRRSRHVLRSFLICQNRVGSRTPKMRLGCPPDQRSALGRPLALPENQRKCSLKPVRPLKLTQTTHVASGSILDALTAHPKGTF